MPSGRTILTRVVFGSIMVLGLCAVLALDGYLELVVSVGPRGVALTGLVVMLIAVAVFEIGRMAAGAGTEVLKCAALLGAVVLGTMPVWQRLGPFVRNTDIVWAVLGLIVAGVFLEAMVRRPIEGALGRIAATLLAVLYLGAGAAAMLAIRVRFGLAELVLFLAVVKFTDIGAYFTGTLVGRHKLIPRLSPGKSWEGLAGGLVVAAGVSILGAWGLGWELRVHLDAWQAAIFGVVVGVAGQFGDLCESLLKRAAQMKDSGAVVPEFGGVLDLLDSPLLAAPVAYLLLNVPYLVKVLS